MKKAYIKIAYMTNYTRMVVDNFLAYDKHYDITKFNFNHIVNESNGEVKLFGEEAEIIKQNSKWILKEYYGIEIINDNPIRIKKEPKWTKLVQK